MFHTQDQSWTKNSVPSSDANVEALFHLPDKFHPDPNDVDEASAIRLETPPQATHGTHQLSSLDALAGFSDLVRYYRRVLDLAAYHDQTYNDFLHHMRLRLVISSGDSAIGFAYADTWRDMKSVSDFLRSAKDGSQYWDADQGWEIIIQRHGECFHFRQGGFDQGGEYANISFSRNQLLNAFEDLAPRIDDLISRLTREFGDDYWSEFRYDLIDYE